MADVGIWTKNADIAAKAGANANATSKAVAWTDLIVLDIEAFVNVTCRTNFSDSYGTLNVDKKSMLKEITTNICAVYVIAYDMSGYTSRIEAEDMINILMSRAYAALELIKDQKSVTFVNGA